MFIKNTSNNGIKDIKEYIYSYKRGEKTIIEDTEIIDLFMFNGEFTSYLCGVCSNDELVPLRVVKNTEEGLTLELVRLDMKLSLNNVNTLFGENILFVESEGVTKIVNLKTRNIFKFKPENNAKSRRVDSKGDNVLFSIGHNHVGFLKDGSYLSIIQVYKLTSYAVNKEDFLAVTKEPDSKQEVVYLDKRTGQLSEQAIQFDMIKGSIFINNKSCFGISNNSLYRIDSPSEAPKLIYTFDSASNVIFEKSNIASTVKTIFLPDEVNILNVDNTIYLIDADGNFIDSEISEVNHASACGFLFNITKDNERPIVYRKHDESAWFYDAASKEKINIPLKEGEEFANLEKYTISYYDSLTETLLDIESISKDFYFEDFSSECAKVAYSRVDSILNNLIGNKTLFIKSLNKKITLYSIEEGQLKPLIVSDNEVQYFDAFLVNELTEEASVSLISYSNDTEQDSDVKDINIKRNLNRIVDVKKITNNGDVFEIHTIDKTKAISEFGKLIQNSEESFFKAYIYSHYDALSYCLEPDDMNFLDNELDNIHHIIKSMLNRLRPELRDEVYTNIKDVFPVL